MESICVPCKAAMSVDHHSGELTLRSPKMMVNRILRKVYYKASPPNQIKKFKCRSGFAKRCTYNSKTSFFI